MAGTIAVVGSDCLLGAAVSKALAKDFSVRAIPLSGGTGYVDQLRGAGITLNNINVHDGASLASALQGVLGCFIVTTTNLKNPDALDEEVKLGRTIADACARAAVPLVVFNTQQSVVHALAGCSARHMDAKATIAQYMRDIGLPLTCVIVPVMYQELLIPPLLPRRVNQFTFALELPLGNTGLNMIGADDVGIVISQIFKQGKNFCNKTVSVSADRLTATQIAADLTQCLAPRVFMYTPITVEELLDQPFPGAKDYAYMFDFICKDTQRTNIDLTRQLNPNVLSLNTWLQQNEPQVSTAVDLSSEPPCVRKL